RPPASMSAPRPRSPARVPRRVPRSSPRRPPAGSRASKPTPEAHNTHLKVRAMAEITAALVKELREKTGAGMMDCKRALGETAGDLEGAGDWLRKKGRAAAAEQSGRLATQGLVGVATKGAV